MICAIPYWVLISFSMRLFFLGLIGGLINTLGLVCLQHALSKGPIGPVSAIAAISNPILVLIEAFKLWKLPSLLEFIAFIVGAYGAIILVLPQFFDKFCFCCCSFVKKKKRKNKR